MRKNYLPSARSLHCRLTSGHPFYPPSSRRYCGNSEKHLPSQPLILIERRGEVMMKAEVCPAGSPFGPSRCRTLILPPSTYDQRSAMSRQVGSKKISIPGRNRDQNPGLTAASGNQIFSDKLLA
ncbi:hypothetical protein AVEN_265898-1 [Araneus ventricosus]|uniref:Uncharacterized protein n=1 Tax=Araneus ventricosus TaxID=182803 RepID=A0A4Y2JEQ2_ARAVE|nr:hypothetical protein AVEN_265898-1 [Araneus ventricosus]